MLVVVIIGIATGMALPSIQQAMRDRRVQQAAVSFINDFREARSRSTMRGRAEIVRVNISAGFALVEIVEGDTASCRLSNWGTPPARLIYQENSWGNPLTMTSENVFTPIAPAGNFMEYCFTPSGRMFYRVVAGGTFYEDNAGVGGASVGGGFMYTVGDNVVTATVVRRVFVPLNGIARLAP